MNQPPPPSDAPTTSTNTTAATAAVAAFMYKSRPLRTEPTASTLAQWQLAFWARLERLVIDEVADACVRVYALEKVLRVKRDQVSQESFLDEALTVRFFFRVFFCSFRGFFLGGTSAGKPLPIAPRFLNLPPSLGGPLSPAASK